MELNTHARIDLIETIEKPLTVGTDQLTLVIFETLVIAGWSMESIEITGEHLRSLAMDEKRLKT